MTNIEKWQLTRNLIDAKKALDSLWYISKHTKELYEVRELCNNKRSDYYINTCAVLDKSICANGRKKSVTSADSTIDRIYTERDKHYAHKDKNYKPSFPYLSLEAEALSLQTELRHIREMCSEYLPDALTLDFVCYDGRLFRQIEKVSPADEEAINKMKYPLFGNKPIASDEGNTFTFKPLYDTDDLNGLSEEERKQYGVVFENGLTFEEGLQKRQDSCIRVNILYDEKMWCSVKEEVWNDIMYYRSIGVFNKYGIIDISKLPHDKFL